MHPSQLEPDLLRLAYRNGFFPMPDPDTGEVLWFNPDPRAILPLDAFHCSRSLRRTLRAGAFHVTMNQAFRAVMLGCADRPETWITEDFVRAYSKLHAMGDAHSVEVWAGTDLVGGVYGVALAGAFFAESMFHRATDASKVALFHLTNHLRTRGFALLEVQFLTPHLASLGAVQIPATIYLERLEHALSLNASF